MSVKFLVLGGGGYFGFWGGGEVPILFLWGARTFLIMTHGFLDPFAFPEFWAGGKKFTVVSKITTQLIQKRFCGAI